MVDVEERDAVGVEDGGTGIETGADGYYLPRSAVDFAPHQFAEHQQAATDEVVEFGADFRESPGGRPDLIGDEPLGVGVVEQGVRAIALRVAEPGDEEGGHADIVDIDGGGHSYTSGTSDVIWYEMGRAGDTHRELGYSSGW